MKISEINPKILKKFDVEERIGSGSFGTVFKAAHKRTNKLFAIKYESALVQPPQLENEVKILKTLTNEIGFPQVHLTLNEFDEQYAIIDYLPNNLENLLEICGGTLSLKSVLMIADQLISRLQSLHQKSFVHRDLKPENIMIGYGNKVNVIYLIDFGLSSSVFDPYTHIHIPFREGKQLVGTVRYASINVHKGYEYSRRDDFESLAYILIYLLKGSLPWQNMKTNHYGQSKVVRVGMKKTSMSVERLCEGLPEEFGNFLTQVRNLGFDEEPHYSAYREMFRNLFIEKGYAYDYKFDWIGHEYDKVTPKEENVQKSGYERLPSLQCQMIPKHTRTSSGDYQIHSFHHIHKTKNFKPKTTMHRSAFAILSYL